MAFWGVLKRGFIFVVAIMVVAHELFKPMKEVGSATTQVERIEPRQKGAAPHIELEGMLSPSSSSSILTTPNSHHHASTTATPSGKDCFHNKVMFQPVFCTKAADILYKALEVGGNGHRRWHVAHVGSREGLIRLAELIDVFGDVAYGTRSAAKLLRSHGVSSFCGSCCECVAADEIKPTVTRYNATLILPEDLHEIPKEVEASYFGHLSPVNALKDSNVRNIVKVEPNSVAACPGTLAAQLRNVTASLLSGSATLDVLTVDAWRCDVHVLAAVTEAATSRKPNFLEITMVNGDVSYEKIVQSLEADYACYFLTTKPEGKRFRGIRQPNYPLAVRVSAGCWRGVYDSFKQERYHLTCHRHSDMTLTTIMSAFTRMTHKGIHAGCSIGQRQEKMKHLARL
mmetsp:Transcript_73503/g.85394  ORF Transcript_73503/g.85394 Transcript_73503/m.85394 type:complete len:399 (-) Transcript_73503:52-1248(-)